MASTLNGLRSVALICRPCQARFFHASPLAQRHYLDADFATFKKATNTEGRVVLVDFYADWCGPCKMLTPVLKELAEGEDANASLTGSRKPIDLVTIDTETEEGQELAVRYSVRALPTVAGFVDGKYKLSFTGAVPRQEIENFLKEL